VSSPRIKNISLFQKCKSWHLFNRPCPHEGAFRDRHDALG
jgi:hypothetical protein